MQIQLTKSESLFRDYCNLHGFVANRIASPTDGSRYPDYEVIIAGNRIIAEIKELQANPNDKMTATILQQHIPEAFGDEPGRRVRTHIEDAEGQLRRYAGQQVPCLVVLYENIIVNGFRPYPPGAFFLDPTNPLWPGHIDVG